MTPRPGSAARGSLLVALLACVLTLAVGACGRRGQPEPPGVTSNSAKPSTPSAAARSGTGAGGDAPASLATSPQAGVQNSPDDESDEDDVSRNVSPQPVPTASRRRGRAYDRPKEPFILDPLL